MQINNMPIALNQFIHEVNKLLDENLPENELHPQVGVAMKALVANDNWLDQQYAQPHPQYYQQYLLYADPDDRFSVVSFVWGPGQHTPIHDHTVWGVVGMLRGLEQAVNYEISPDGTPTPVGTTMTLTPGDIALVSPMMGDVHKVQNALDDQVSISIHVYGGNIGNIKRHVFPEQGGAAKDFISGYANAAA
jgi:3-mercaptopropionate dioxygenase